MTWHIALTESGADAMAADALKRREYHVYRPVIPVVRPHGRGRLRRIVQSMFPGYLLVIDSRCQGWLRLRTAPGIRPSHSLMMSNGRLAQLSDGVVTDIASTERSIWSKSENNVSASGLKVGQTVKIQINPVTDLLGTIENLDDLPRICVLTTLLGRESRVTVSRSNLMAI